MREMSSYVNNYLVGSRSIVIVVNNSIRERTIKAKIIDGVGHKTPMMGQLKRYQG